MTGKVQQLNLITVSAMLVLCAVAVTFLTLYTLTISHWHGPFRDMWEIYPFLQKIMAGSWGLSDLWESYGYSHRLFLPRLLFIADHRFFDATNHLLIIVSIICQLLICILCSLLVWRDNSISVAIKYAFTAVLVSLQFSATLLFNFMHTFDVQWFLCCFFIVAAFYQLSCLSVKTPMMSDKSCAYHLIISGLFIVAACLNNFSGMAAWPIWLVLVFSRMQNLKIKILLTIIATLFVAFYISGVRSAFVAQEGISQFFRFFTYIFITFPLPYLANPLSDTDFLPFGYFAVLVVIPALYVLAKFWITFLLNQHDGLQNRLVFFLACIGLFGYGVAVITAIGRGYDPGHVRAMRYQNIVMLFWSAVILLAILESRHYLMQPRYLLRLPFVAAFFGFMWCQNLSWNQNIWLGYQVKRAHLALMMGYANDVPMIAPTVSRSMIYVPGYNLERERALYESERMGIYQGAMAADWLNGIAIPSGLQACSKLTWSLSPYEGAYSRYTRFLVSGDTANFSQAYLISNAGKVLAIAIPDTANNLASSLRASVGLYRPTLKGFAVSNDKPYALVMSGNSGTSTNCIDLFEPRSQK